jgi:hypothetical protein
MGHSPLDPAFEERRPWNEGWLLGAKRALKQQQVWAIRFWLDQHRRLSQPRVQGDGLPAVSVDQWVRNHPAFLFIDPHLSVLTDDAVDGQMSEGAFRRSVIWISAGQPVWTALAQLRLELAPLMPLRSSTSRRGHEKPLLVSTAHLRKQAIADGAFGPDQICA